MNPGLARCARSLTSTPHSLPTAAPPAEQPAIPKLPRISASRGRGAREASHLDLRRAGRNLNSVSGLASACGMSVSDGSGFHLTFIIAESIVVHVCPRYSLRCHLQTLVASLSPPPVTSGGAGVHALLRRGGSTARPCSQFAGLVVGEFKAEGSSPCLVRTVIDLKPNAGLESNACARWRPCWRWGLRLRRSPVHRPSFRPIGPAPSGRTTGYWGTVRSSPRPASRSTSAPASAQRLSL